MWLMALLLFKHWLADFPWQNQWMVRNKGNLASGALAAHVMVHQVSTAAVLFIFTAVFGIVFDAVEFFGVVMAEATLHYVIDAIKCHPRLGARWPLPHPRFWTMLGLDQLLHHLCYIAMTAYLLPHAT